MSSYYDIDSILAEEELIPSTTLFDFSHLSYLDPEGRHHHHRQQQQQRRSKHDDNHDEDGQPQQQQQHERGGGGGMTSHLPEGSQIKMPLWALDKWSTLGYVQMSLPRHFSRKARERLDADPGEADLRKRNERFFQSGRMLVDLIEKSVQRVSKELTLGGSSSSSRRTSAQQQKLAKTLEHSANEAYELKRTLLKTYAGERLRRTLDWSLSSGGDEDVSRYIRKLTEMEQRLFYRGSSSIVSHDEWTMFGNRYYGSRRSSSSLIDTTMTTTTPGGPSTSTGRKNTSHHAITPGDDDDDNNARYPRSGQRGGGRGGNDSSKRRRVDV